MRVERSYLVRVVQVYEGDGRDIGVADQGWGYLDSDQDQCVCDNWKLVEDRTEFVDDDQLESRVLAGGEA